MSSSETVREMYDLACPKCGDDDTLQLVISTWATLSTEGTEPFGDHEWDGAASCRCRSCKFTSDVRSFSTVPKTVTDHVRVALRTLASSCEEALDGSWDRSDHGFEDMIEVAERAIAKLDEVRS